MKTEVNSADSNSCDSVSNNDFAMMIFKSWQDQYQLIHHLILYSNILMIVQGRKHSGKSSYLKGLITKLPDEFSCQIVAANQIQSKSALELAIRQLFSLSSLSSKDQSQQPSIIAQVQKNHKHCLLIIDDAHLLCEEVLSEILSLLRSQENATFLHCLLMGDPLLSAKFSEPNFASCVDAMTHFIDMPELDLQEAKLLLTRKFSSLGKAQITSVSDDSIKRLIKSADGNINKLCGLARDKLKGGEVDKGSNLLDQLKRIRHVKLAGTAVAGIFCFMMLISLKTINTEEQKIQQLVLPQKIKLLPAPQQVISQKIPDEEKATQIRPELPATIELTQQKTPAVKHEGYVPMSMIPNYKLLAKKGVKKTKVKFSQTDKPLTRALKFKGESLKKKTVTDTVKLEAKSASTLRLAQSAVITSNVGKAAVAKVVAPKKIAESKTIRVAKKATAVRQKPKAIALVRVGQGYGIQLAASSNIKALKRFARANHIFAQARYYTTVRKGKRWYMLVLGDYGSKEQATKAKSSLSSSLKAKKPWLRSIKGLKEIK